MKLKRISELGEVVSGATPRTDTPAYWNGDIPWVSPKELSDLQGQYLNTTIQRITQAGFDSCSTNMLPKGSVLFSSRAPIGLVAIAGLDLCTNQGFKSIIPHAGTDPLYLYYALKYHAPRLQALGTGTTFLELSKGKFADFKLPIPDTLDEQRRIAALLSRAEGLIAQRKENLRMLDDLVRSVFLEMFGDPVRNEKGWERQTLSELVDPECPLTYGIVQPGDEYPDGTPIVRPVDLYGDDFITTKGLKRIDPEFSRRFSRSILRGDEILMTVRGSIGGLAMATPEHKGSNVTRGIMPMWFKDDYPKLFAYFLLKSLPVQQVFDKLTSGATLLQINLGKLRSMKLIKPPFEQTHRFALVAQHHLTIKEHYRSSLDSLEQLYGSLSQRAFRGELSISRFIQLDGSPLHEVDGEPHDEIGYGPDYEYVQWDGPFIDLLSQRETTSVDASTSEAERPRSHDGLRFHPSDTQRFLEQHKMYSFSFTELEQTMRELNYTYAYGDLVKGIMYGLTCDPPYLSQVYQGVGEEGETQHMRLLFLCRIP